MHCSTGWRHMYSTSQKKKPQNYMTKYTYTEQYKHVCHPRVLVTDFSVHVCYCTLYSYSKLKEATCIKLLSGETPRQRLETGKGGGGGGGSWSRADATKCLSGRKVTFRVNIIWFLLLTRKTDNNNNNNKQKKEMCVYRTLGYGYVDCYNYILLLFTKQNKASLATRLGCYCCMQWRVVLT